MGRQGRIRQDAGQHPDKIPPDAGGSRVLGKEGEVFQKRMHHLVVTGLRQIRRAGLIPGLPILWRRKGAVLSSEKAGEPGQ